jgi:adenylate cyclase
MRFNKQPSAGWRLPITSTLLAGFGGLVAAAVAAVMLISMGAAQENTNDLLAQSAAQRLDAAIARVDRYLEPVAADVNFLAEQLSYGDDISLDDDRQIEVLMRGALGATPQAVGMAFLRTNMTSVRSRRGRDRERDSIDTIAGSVAREGYGSRLLEQARHLHGVAWNDMFYIKELDATFISAMAPVTRGGQFRGVVIAAVTVDRLSQLIDSGDSGSTLFILSANDEVIAHPELAPGRFKPTPDHFMLRRLQLQDPVMRALWSARPDNGLAGRVHSATTAARRIELAGETDVALLRELNRYSAQPWVVGIYFPTAQFSEPIMRLRLAVAIGFAILALGVGLALLLGRSLARPIRRLAASAELISAFDFSDAGRLGHSPFREIDAAGRAWESMLAALRWFETYVPKALVGQLLRHGPDVGLTAEEREVTVMFTDIAGFSRIATLRSPAELAEFLNRHFGVIGREIEASGGTIDKYIGDSMMAFWGAPASDPAHAENACRAALAIAAAIAEDNRRRAHKGLLPVRMRIGIHSGRAVVGNVGAPGRVNYTLIGDTVNAAQRLEQLGKTLGDETAHCIVLASAATVRGLPPDIARVSLGERLLRGMGSMEVFRLLPAPTPSQGEPVSPHLSAQGAKLPNSAAIR